jgi:NADH:ubiquinone reductase (H+-translocating)
MADRKRVVILGGGFAGVYTAMALEKALGRHSDVDLVLVSRENYLVFQPMLPEVISGSIGLTDVVSPIRRLAKRTELHMRDVEGIDLERKVVVATPGFRPQPHLIPYDHLVLALGTVTDFRGMRGLAEHAFKFKNLVDALALRNHVIRAVRESAIERDPEFRRELLTFVVAGGGFSGVEAIAELNDFVRRMARSFHAIDPKEIRVVLLHAGDRILPEMAPDLALFAQKILAKRGVEIRFNARLEAATSDAAVLKGGERIATRTIVSTVPAFPHPLLEALPLPKGKGGRLKSTAQLQVEGTTNVWALGDCALVPMTNGELAPPTAQHAIRQAAVAAHNIVATLRGSPRRTFTFTGLGKMGSLGHRSAVAEVFGVKISGLLAWFVWRTIYLAKMPGLGRRLKVASAWALDLVLPPDLVELRFGDSRGMSQEHFEPGEDVFREGDIGDRIYLVLKGEAEVLRQSNGADQFVALLGPGDWFGEAALMNDTTRGATIRCRHALDALSLPRKEFAVLAANLPDLHRSFDEIMERRDLRRTGAPPIPNPLTGAPSGGPPSG